MAKVLSYCGHECVLWDMSKQSSMDMFYQLSPDLVFTNTKDVDDGIVAVYTGYRNTKFCLTASDDDSFVFNEVEYIRHFKDNRLLLTFPGRDEVIRKSAKYWINFGFWVTPSLTAADVFGYKPGETKPEFISDVSLIGKPNPISEYYMSTLCRPDSPFRTKIFGNGNWGVPQECGEVSEAYYPDICASSKVCAVFNEKRGNEFTINDMFWYMAINKHFFITNKTDELESMFGDSLSMFSSQNEFLDQVEKFTSNPRLRTEHINKIQAAVLTNHTYFHRATEIFNNLNMPYEANECSNKFEEFQRSV